MKPFLTTNTKLFTRVMQLAKWAKKYAKYGAYIEVDANEFDFTVRLFCPKLHTDPLGNTAQKPVNRELNILIDKAMEQISNSQEFA